VICGSLQVFYLEKNAHTLQPGIVELSNEDTYQHDIIADKQSFSALYGKDEW